jgi:asparagine synthase (glutamine-hydrolysing)
MCGIAGIIGCLNKSNRNALKRINDALAHRGPDGESLWESPPDKKGWGVMFAHRRLSILDLTPSAAQPMVDPVTGHVVVFNGEIYNYVELRRRLSSEGQSFQSTGDTAVMLRLLALHGRQAVRDLRGMFAFAIWDPNQRKLFLARDSMGIKPLYLARNHDPSAEWSLIFASEVRAILASGLLGRPRLNPRAIASVVWNGFVVSPNTAVVGIEPIWPGRGCLFDSSGHEELADDYWSAARRHATHHIDDSNLSGALEECVREHLASDVPLAVFLSSGVDSAAVANLAHKTSKVPVHTFTMAFEEQDYNEGVAAKRIASAIGTQHEEVVLTEQQFIGGLDAALYSLDQPTFDGLNSYYMAQAVAEAGFKVALVGTGGDELFGGYTSFRDLPRLFLWRNFANWIPEHLMHKAARFLSSLMQPSSGIVPPQTRWAKLPEMVRHKDDLLSLYQLAYALFLPDFQRELVCDAADNDLADGLPIAMRERLLREICSRSPLSAISVLEHRLFLGERLLRDTDATSMAASIEVRLPLVDHQLFEKVDRLHDQERYYPLQKKLALRHAGLRELDPGLFNRPKSGFVLPYDRWLRMGVGKVIDQTMRDPAAVKPTGLNPAAVLRLWQSFLDGAPGLYWSRVWAIYVLIQWCHRNNVYL